MPPRGLFVERCENEASAIRKNYGFPKNDPLNPFHLADSLGIKVIDLKELTELTEKDLEIIRSVGKEWSGLSFSSPDGKIIVLLNPYHGQARQKITLMEEICHFRYHHKPRVKVNISISKIEFQGFSEKDEKEAYWIAAASLVPYSGLREMVSKGNTIKQIAFYFEIGIELVNFRLKVTRLLSLYRQMQKVKALIESS